jgi:hypothetical protein
MELSNFIAQLTSQLNEVVIQQEQNQQEQELASKSIFELEAQLQQKYTRQRELDFEAIGLYRKAQDIEVKLNKMKRISSIKEEFKQLVRECGNDRQLLDTLYESLVFDPALNESQIDRTETIEPDPFTKEPFGYAESLDVGFFKEELEDLNLTVESIEDILPKAREIYQYLTREYSDRQEFYAKETVEGLDFIWCAVAFIARGRELYRKLSRRHHPDLNGTAQSMQFINAAWEVSQEYIASMRIKESIAKTKTP